MVAPAYWNRPEATAESIPNGRLLTGDVGFVDRQAWVYGVDRKKDMINASGFKMWSSEVEDVLYRHPTVGEAAVVRAPDPYRGETVAAFVSMSPVDLPSPTSWSPTAGSTWPPSRPLGPSASGTSCPRPPEARPWRRELRGATPA